MFNQLGKLNGMSTKAIKILAFSGSSRKGSINKKLLDIAIQGARDAGADVTLFDLRELNLPIYDGDLEAEKGVPENVLKLREIMLEHQGLLIASAEYNGSVSALLKNSIDWASRPAGGLDG